MYIEKFKYQIIKLCETNNVKRLFVFGSVLTSKFNKDSDIDFVVEIFDNDPVEYAENYFNLKFGFEDLLNKPVDLLENKAIKNPYLKRNIDKSKVLIYEKKH